MKNEISVQSFGSGDVLNRQQVWKVVGVILLVCGLQLYGKQAATPATFDPPDSQGTYPTAITPSGVIAGYYLDTIYGTNHGFVRSRDGTITPFDPPGYPPGSTNTIVTAITPEGKITGYYTDTSGVTHGFLRASNGKFSTIDYPLGLGTPPLTAPLTAPLAINPAGEITGYYFDAFFLNHGFLRTPGGTFTTVDVPPQGSTSTTPEAINSKGEIMGFYSDSSGAVRVFLRAKNGTFTPFAPAASLDPSGMFVGFAGGSFIPNADGSISPAGSVAGYFTDSSGVWGFLRTPDGTITPINEPNSANSAHWTYVNAINPSGTIIGAYLDNTSSSTSHGFVRDRKGNYTTIDGPNSPLPPFLPPLFTSATAINPAGEITGSYQDADNRLFHGFVLIPAHPDDSTGLADD
jgi:hypothetical protein